MFSMNLSLSQVKPVPAFPESRLHYLFNSSSPASFPNTPALSGSWWNTPDLGDQHQVELE